VKESERDRLRATAEELIGSTKPLDLFERETLEQIRMDRAERKARERGEKNEWSEAKIQEQAEKRRWWRNMPENVARGVATSLLFFGLKKAKSELDKL
jgi:hypothetical protein